MRGKSEKDESGAAQTSLPSRVLARTSTLWVQASLQQQDLQVGCVRGGFSKPATERFVLTSDIPLSPDRAPTAFAPRLPSALLTVSVFARVLMRCRTLSGGRFTPSFDETDNGFAATRGAILRRRTGAILGGEPRSRRRRV